MYRNYQNLTVMTVSRTKWVTESRSTQLEGMLEIVEIISQNNSTGGANTDDLSIRANCIINWTEFQAPPVRD